MAKPPSILIAIRDSQLEERLRSSLKEGRYRLTSVGDLESLLQEARTHTHDAVLCDLELPGAEGLDTIRKIHASDSGIAIVLCAEFSSVRTAVEAMRIGAYDFVEPPVKDDEVRSVLARAVLKRKRESGNREKKPAGGFKMSRIVGDSKPMQQVLRMVHRVAPTDSTVLILGESGTGKELVANAIHHLSERRNRSLVTINCGAIPQELLESELFGYERGAFTGAYRSRVGRFELADGGTVFLDEIGDMPLALQVKMLRVLQEKTIERIGGANSVTVDVRIIAATNQDLEAAIGEKTFREDLYYRLNVFPIRLPSLKERKEDLPALSQCVLERLRDNRDHGIIGFTDEVMDAFMQYHWPGNVRELENVIERAVILKDDGRIEIEDLPSALRTSSGPAAGPAPEFEEIPRFFQRKGVSFSTAVTEFERQLILEALDRTNWVKNKAAKLLDMKRTTLVEKMKRINLERESS